MEERELCDIFRKLALGEELENEEELKEALFSLTDEVERELKEHIKKCYTCFDTIKKMGVGDKSFVCALLNTDIDLILKKEV